MARILAYTSITTDGIIEYYNVRRHSSLTPMSLCNQKMNFGLGSYPQFVVRYGVQWKLMNFALHNAATLARTLQSANTEFFDPYVFVQS